MKRRIALVFTILAALLPLGGSARACTCAAGDPRASLAASDAAFIGSVISRNLPEGPITGGEKVTLRFRVDVAVKGRLGREVIVSSGPAGGTCGISAAPGRETGLFLTRHGTHWTSSLCAQIDPDLLRRAAEPLPAPDSKGPVSFLMGGRLGDVRTIALDRDARVVAYGKGEGYTAGLAVCKGSRRFVEIVIGGVPDRRWSVGLAVRDVETLQSLRESRLEELETGNQPTWFTDVVSCRDPTGQDVFVLARDNSDERLKVIRVHGRGRSVVFEGPGRAGAFSAVRDVAYLAAEKSIVELDMHTGRTRPFAKLPLTPRSLVLNPRESVLTGTTVSGWPKGSVFTLDMRSRKFSTARGFSGWSVWLDDSTFVVIPGEGEVRVYEASLRLVSSWKGWTGYPAVAVDGTLFSAGGGRVVTASGLRGGVRVLREFDSPEVFDLEYVRAPSASPGPRWSLLVLAAALAALGIALGLRQAKARGHRP